MEELTPAEELEMDLWQLPISDEDNDTGKCISYFTTGLWASLWRGEEMGEGTNWEESAEEGAAGEGSVGGDEREPSLEATCQRRPAGGLTDMPNPATYRGRCLFSHHPRRSPRGGRENRQV